MHSHHARKAFELGALVTSLLLVGSCESPNAPRSLQPSAPSLLESEPEGAVVVTGTGDPSIDVPAVQTAVDQGGRVVLRGHFSFDQPPTQPIAPPFVAANFPPAAQVLVSKAVSITGDDDEPATIDAGTIPFYVDAAGQSVTFERLHFVRPTEGAILVFAVSGLEVASSSIDGLVPYKGLASGIWVDPSANVPMPTKPWHPENVSGTLRIIHNDFDLTGGTATDNTLGITIFGVGVEGAEVSAEVIGNRIRNVTEPAINFRQIVGTARIEHNRITTGSLAGTTATRNQAIRVVNTGTYLIAHNFIECNWANAEAQAIGVFSQFSAWPIQNAVVADNDIDMAAPDGTVFTDFSAGIGVYGYANANLVERNRIRGQARAGISMPVFPLTGTPAIPANNAFIRNRFVRFTPSLDDYFLGNSIGTVIVEAGGEGHR